MTQWGEKNNHQMTKPVKWSGKLINAFCFSASYWMKTTSWFGASLSTCRKDEPWSACSKSLQKNFWERIQVRFGSSGEKLGGQT